MKLNFVCLKVYAIICYVCKHASVNEINWDTIFTRIVSCIKAYYVFLQKLCSKKEIVLFSNVIIYNDVLHSLHEREKAKTLKYLWFWKLWRHVMWEKLGERRTIQIVKENFDYSITEITLLLMNNIFRSKWL